MAENDSWSVYLKWRVNEDGSQDLVGKIIVEKADAVPDHFDAWVKAETDPCFRWQFDAIDRGNGNTEEDWQWVNSLEVGYHSEGTPNLLTWRYYHNVATPEAEECAPVPPAPEEPRPETPLDAFEPKTPVEDTAHELSVGQPATSAPDAVETSTTLVEVPVSAPVPTQSDTLALTGAGVVPLVVLGLGLAAIGQRLTKWSKKFA